MRRHLSRHHQGQSLVTVAIFAFLLFLVMGLAIDGGLIYMQRRFMQNTADAACLTASNQISLGKSNTDATTAAQNLIIKNLDSNAAGMLSYSAKSDFYSPSIPSSSPATLAGVNLVKGIEISGPDVRVALQSPANTTFMRIAGINTYNISARAHCNAKAGGGGVPFAISRWRGYNDKDDVLSGLTTSEALPQQYRKGKNTDNMTVRDVLQARSTNDGKCCSYSSSTGSMAWPWGGPSALPGDPDAHTGIYTQASPPASEANPGYPTIVAGKDANPNVGDPTFNGPLILDFRNFISGPDYYPPLTASDLTSSLQKFKDLATEYILNGYHDGPLPQPGDQVAYYSGLSAGQIEKPFSARYKVGDIVTAFVYNGTTYKDESFSVDVKSGSDDYQERAKTSTPKAPNCTVEKSKYIYDDSGYDPAKYSFTVAPEDPAKSFSSSYKMRAFFSVPGSNFSDTMGRWGTSGTWTSFDTEGRGPQVTTPAAGPNFDFQLKQDKTATCLDASGTPVTYPDRTSGLQTTYLEWEADNGQRRARYALINMKDADSNDFYAYFPGELLYQAVEPGGHMSSPMSIETENGSLVNNPTISYQWFDASSPYSTISSCNTDTCKGVSVGIKKKAGSYSFEVDVDSDEKVAVPGQYYVRIEVKKSGFTKWAWYYIKVNPPLSNASSLKKYVYILGYARFRVTKIASNYIEGVAVSGLLTTEEEIKYGFTPRLLPWE